MEIRQCKDFGDPWGYPGGDPKMTLLLPEYFSFGQNPVRMGILTYIHLGLSRC